MQTKPQAPEQAQATTTSTAPKGFKRILVALDHSDQAEAVFAHALNLARDDDSRLMVLHILTADVVPASDFMAAAYTGIYGAYSPVTLADAQHYVEEAIAQAQEWLGSLCETAQTQGIPSEYDCRRGDPGHRICEFAKNWEADLIILGRRGRSGLSEMMLGSVSNYVLHHATCSVLIVQ
jgi:nucleotide-binding universal stress UspA family protein